MSDSKTYLSAGIIFYQDCKSLERTLRSLKDFDLVICVDGKFKLFDSDNELSNDGSRELVKSYNNMVLIDAPDLSEPEKRNKYMEFVSEFLLVIDSDEWIEGDIEQFRNNLFNLPDEQVFNINAWIKAVGGHTLYPRLFKQPYKMRYGQTHNTLVYNNSIFRIKASPDRIVEGITIKADDSLRSKEWIDKCYQYQVKLIEYERPIKRELHL